MKPLAALSLASVFCLVVVAACSDSDESGNQLAGATTGTSSGGAGGGTGGAAQGGDFGSGGFGSGGSPAVEQFTELWYSVDDLLVRIALDKSDGSVADFQSATMMGTFPVGQNAITMLADGSLLGARLSQLDDETHFYWIAEPPRDGSDVTPQPLGVMPDAIMLEGLYTDCEGRVYGMDTGSDDTNADGNRLLRFTADVTAGDFTFVVVSDLGTADVADIDDMSPGIDNNNITDNPGLALDSGTVHHFNYETGSGTQVGMGGTYGIHALGGPLFNDLRSRLYVLSIDGELFELDPVSYTSSGVLGSGPTPTNGIPGWSGLAGPLTDCESGFVPK